MARRPCHNADGSNKRRYLSRKAAKRQCLKGQGVYQCDLHGEPVWHVGRTRYKPKNAPQEVTPAALP